MAALGWYGPLIDLSESPSYVGHYVQLIVFVHTTRHIKKLKSLKEGALLRTDVQVGDDTRSYFAVAIWHKEMGSTITPGDVVLLQNVQIVKFGDIIEAQTVQFSSLSPLVHPYKLLVSKGLDDLLSCCRVGETTKEKLNRVINWVKQGKTTLPCAQEHNYQKRQVCKNWKRRREQKYYDCISVSEVLSLTICCNASFYALVGEIFVPSIRQSNVNFDKERMFISKRLLIGEHKLAEDFICLGCKLCGHTMNSYTGRSSGDEIRFPLYCPKSSNQLHVVCWIYKPFLLYVRDRSECIPLHVTNKEAEVLFGNITAESVHSSYTETMKDIKSCLKDDEPGHGDAPIKDAGGFVGSQIPKDNKEVERQKMLNLYSIWLILLKVLLQQGKNSFLRFEVTVNASLNHENGRFALVSVTMPCTITNHH